MDARELIASNLCRLLSASNMSKSELATRLNVSKTAVSSWCLGLKAPRMDKIDAMAQIFGVTRSAFYAEVTHHIIAPTDNPKINHIFQNAQYLNDVGLQRLSDYSDDLVASGNYQKNKPSEEG